MIFINGVAFEKVGRKIWNLDRQLNGTIACQITETSQIIFLLRNNEKGR
jgi:hypothetical protein